MIEKWSDIEGYEGLYQISSLGEVKSLERVVDFGLNKRIVKEAIRKVKDNGNGYLHISIYNKKIERTLYIHRLVAKAFCSGFKSGYDVNHKDGNKKNNYYENLEWCSRSDNQIHAYRTLKRPCYATGRFGVINKRSIPITQHTLTGEFIRSFDSATSAERELGFSESGIRKCLYGEMKQSKGYIWKYSRNLTPVI